MFLSQHQLSPLKNSPDSFELGVNDVNGYIEGLILVSKRKQWKEVKRIHHSFSFLSIVFFSRVKLVCLYIYKHYWHPVQMSQESFWGIHSHSPTEFWVRLCCWIGGGSACRVERFLYPKGSKRPINELVSLTRTYIVLKRDLIMFVLEDVYSILFLLN